MLKCYRVKFLKLLIKFVNITKCFALFVLEFCEKLFSTFNHAGNMFFFQILQYAVAYQRAIDTRPGRQWPGVHWSDQGK